MSFSSFFSSFLNVVHADAEEKEEVVVTPQVEEKHVEEQAEEPEDVSTNTSCIHSLFIFL